MFKVDRSGSVRGSAERQGPDPDAAGGDPTVQWSDARRRVIGVPRDRPRGESTCPSKVPAEFWPMFWLGARGSDAVLPRDAFHVACTLLDCIESAIAKVPVTDDRWLPAVKQNGEKRPGAAVADLTKFVDTSHWPAGTRLIVRREPRHPGAQRSLMPSDNWRYWGHWTDQPGNPTERDTHMRAHAVVEQHIAALKASGLNRMPFKNFDANAALSLRVRACLHDLRGTPQASAASRRRLLPQPVGLTRHSGSEICLLASTPDVERERSDLRSGRPDAATSCVQFASRPTSCTQDIQRMNPEQHTASGAECGIVWGICYVWDGTK
jgi:hypothetical protein